MKKIYILSSLLVFLCFFTTSYASHVPGGNITYTCVGPNQYFVTLTLFENCSTGFGIGGSKTINARCGTYSTNYTLTQASGPTEVSQLCAAQMSQSQCANPSNPHPGVEMATFTGTITLPYTCNAWTLSYGLCCRNTSVNVSGQPDFYVETTLNNLTSDPCNHSPYVTAQPIPYACLYQPVNYNLGAVDPNGDSLSFALVSALYGPSSPVTYNAGFSGTQPIPGAAINAQTGQITFTPNATGSYVFAVMITEWDSLGVISSTVLHDFRFEVIGCINQTPSAPSSGMSGFTGSGVQTGPNSIEGCPGDNFCFNLTFSDPNILDVLTVLSNVTSALPGATITITGTNPVTATICWTIPATAGGIYTFTVTAKDDACPVFGQVTYPLTVNVLQGVNAGPDQTICSGQSAQLSATGGSTFTWSVVSGPAMSSSNFSCSNCASPVATPTATTTYAVVSNLSPANCDNNDTVVVTVVPTFTVGITPANPSICMNQVVQLTASGTAAQGPYTYQWSPATGLSSTTAANPMASPLVTTTYTVSLTSAAGCTKTGTVTVTVTGIGPTVTVSPDTSICLGQSVPINTTIALQPGFCGPNTAPCTGTTTTGTIGTGALNTDYAGPFHASSSPLTQYALKHQYIYTAAELQAAGYTTGGTINAIALDITTTNGTAFQNFNIKMGCTSTINYSNGNYIQGLTNVYSTSLLTTPTTPGWYTIPLQTPYNWDGVSNIVVEFCSNGTVMTSSQRVSYTSTSPFYRAIYNYSSTGGCNQVVGTRNYMRPNMQFTICQGQVTSPTYSWTPTAGLSNPNIPNPIATPTATTTYVLNVTDQGSGCIGSATINIGVGPDYTLTTSNDTSICYGNTVQLQTTPSTAGSYTYDWSPALGLSNDTVSNPNASPGITTTYAVEVSNGNCVKRDTVSISVYGVPVTVTITNDTVCPGTQVQLDVTTSPTACGINPVGCSGTSNVSSIGNGTLTGSSNTPFYGSMEDSRVQYLFRANDLLASGVSPGTITKLAWKVTSKNSAAPFSGFTIKMGCTNATTLTTAGWLPTAGAVYGPTNYSTVLGWNTITLATAFDWDGMSNIVIEVCFDNNLNAGMDNIEYTGSIPYYGSMRASMNGSAGCNLNPTVRYMMYPNMQFTVCHNSLPPNASYTWTPAYGLSNPSIPNPVATINSNITYSVSISDPTLPGCSSNATVSAYINNTNTVIASNDTSICPGGSAQLNAIFTGPLPASSIPCGINNTSCTGPINQVAIGNGTSSNSSYSYPAIYGNYYWGAKHQILYRASDLAAMGMQSGTISELAFDVAAVNSTSTYDNVTIKMGCTSQQSLSSWASGLQTVYTSPAYTITTGWNAHPLTSTFDWDGVSNLIVEFCFNNSSWVTNAQTYYTPTPYTSVLYYRADNSNVCNSSGYISTSTFRPNTRFKICYAPPVMLTYLWSPSAGLSNDTIPNPVATPAATTTYVITAMGGVCDVTDTVVVNVNTANPAITASGPTTFCQGDSVTLTSSITNNILWSNGTTTPAITVLNSGTFSVTDNTCNTTSSPVTVTVNPNPAPTVTASGPTTFCSGGSVTLTSSSATGNTWSTGATTQSITVNTSGSYSVSVTNSNGCTATSTPVTVTVNPNPSPVITAGGPTTFCQGGSVTLTSSEMNGNAWSNAATSQSITVSNAGSYTVSVTDANGCSGTSAPVTVTVNNNPAPSITASGPTAFCAGDSVVLSSSFTNGNTWSTNASTQSITVTSSGVYTVSVTNAFGCTGTSSPVTVTVNNAPSPTITASGPTTFCQGDSVTLTSSETSGNTWSNNAATQSITVYSPGTYSVSVMDANGCVASSSPVTVTVNNNPSVTVTASGPTTFCQGGDVTLTSSALSGNTWSNNANTQSITVNTAGTYSVSVTDVNGCTGTSNPVTVNVNPNSIPSITAGGPTTFCQGDSVILTSSINNNNVWSTGAVTQSITVTTPGSYTVTDNSGCGGTSSPVNVTVNPAPSVTITAGGPTTFCQGGNVVLTSSEASGNTWSSGQNTQSITVTSSGTYSVSINVNGCPATSNSITVNVNPNSIPSITAGGPTTFCQGGSVVLTSSISNNNSWSTGATTQSITVSASGTYTVTDNSGCGGTSSPVTVTVNNNPSASITASGPTTFCQGDSVTLTSSSASGNAWSNGSNAQSITVMNPGVFTVSVTDANGCSSTSSPVTVMVNNNPSPSITAGGSTTFCQGGSVTLSSSASGGNTWSTGATSQSITVNSSGSYSVTVLDANGCTGTSTPVTVTVNNNPAPVITASGPTTFCQGDNVTLTSSEASGNMWSNSAASQSITVSSAGTYSTTVTDANGCTGTSSPVTVTVNSNPTVSISASGPATFCQGDSVTLTSSEASGNIWSNNANTQSITVSSSGTYSVTATNSSGCSATSSPVTVTVNSNPSPTITAGGPTTFCQGGNVLLASNYSSGNLWSNAMTSQNITATTSGTYSVTVTDQNNCTGSASITVTVNSNPAVSISASGPTTFCQGDSVTLTSTVVNGNAWSNGPSTQSIVVISSGTYSTTVTDANGCTATSNAITVNVNPNSVPSIMTSGPTTFCQGGSVVLTSSINNNNQWSTGATTQSITVNSSGTFTVSDNSGCGGTSQPVTVTVNQNPSPVITANGPTTFCQGGSVTLSCSPSGTYSWSNGGNGSITSITNSGAYTVTLTDANGCSATSQPMQVTVNPNPVVAMSSYNPVCAGDPAFALTGATPPGGSYSGTGVSGGNFDPSQAGIGIHNIMYVYVSSAGCSDTGYVSITVNGQQNAAITSAGPVCENGNDINLVSADSGGAWSGAGIVDNIEGMFSPSTAGPGTHQVIYTISGTCGDVDTISIVVNPLPVADAGSDQTIDWGESVNLNASGGGTYSWSPSDGLSCTACDDPGASPTETTTYYVTVTSANGCTSMDSVTVYVEMPDGELFVPNMFSPNDDGVNDHLLVFGNNIEAIQLTVYNRWGQKVFESTNISNGWDGTFNGQKLDPAVFVYYVKATYSTGRSVKKSGNVTLVR